MKLTDEHQRNLMTKGTSNLTKEERKEFSKKRQTLSEKLAVAECKLFVELMKMARAEAAVIVNEPVEAHLRGART